MVSFQRAAWAAAQQASIQGPGPPLTSNSAARLRSGGRIATPGAGGPSPPATMRCRPSCRLLNQAHWPGGRHAMCECQAGPAFGHMAVRTGSPPGDSAGPWPLDDRGRRWLSHCPTTGLKERQAAPYTLPRRGMKLQPGI